MKLPFPPGHVGKTSLKLYLLPNSTAGHYITFNGTGIQLLKSCLYPDSQLTLSPSGGDLERKRDKRIQKKGGNLLKRKALSSDEISLQSIKPGVKRILSLRPKDMKFYNATMQIILIDKSQPHHFLSTYTKRKTGKRIIRKDAKRKNSIARENQGRVFTFLFVRNDLLKCIYCLAQVETGREREGRREGGLPFPTPSPSDVF